MASIAAQTALKSFVEKARPTGFRPIADQDLPGVSDQDTLGSGLGIDEWSTLMSGFFSLLSREANPANARDLDPEEVLPLPIEFQLLVDLLSNLRPLPLDESDVDVIIRLCDPDQLRQLTEGLSNKERRECFLRAGYYEEAKEIAGWDAYGAQLYPWTAGFRDLGITNGEAYDLCAQFQAKGIVGNVPEMVGLYHDIAQTAILSRRGQSPIVRIEGGPGSGKSVIARTLHDLAARKMFRDLNASALPENLAESELFGHVKGAFTGATNDRDGLLEECSENGTFLLNDLNHMNPTHLPKLLQVLEERSIAKIGYSKPIDISGAMIVITSNEDLDTKQGFPPDLLERISPHVFRMPDLVSRVRDVPNLTRYCLEEEAGSEEIAQFQFQVARKLRMWAHEDMLSVRSISNEIAGLCRRSQGDLSELLSNPDEGRL